MSKVKDCSVDGRVSSVHAKGLCANHYKKTRINSKQKGKRGEREFRDVLRRHGYTAHRGQQFRGSSDSPDVICEGLPFRFEVKYRERIQIRKSYEQAVKDCGDNIPIVAHRSSGESFLVTLSADDFLKIIKFWPLLK